tara:strand:+ start:675 stop:794 length:120 start_codon:yes stop_codon:yes gene_type:complete
MLKEAMRLLKKPKAIRKPKKKTQAQIFELSKKKENRSKY